MTYVIAEPCIDAPDRACAEAFSVEPPPSSPGAAGIGPLGVDAALVAGDPSRT